MSNDKLQKQLDPLFKEAEQKGLWFWYIYQDMWFTPAELREHQSNGRFQLGAVYWRLRDPRELIEQKRKTIENLTQELEKLKMKVWEATWAE